MEPGGQPFRGTVTATDLYVGSGRFTLLGCRLIAAAAAATAQLVDGDGVVLADLAAPIGGTDELNIPVVAQGKVRLGTLTGAGAIVNIFIQ